VTGAARGCPSRSGPEFVTAPKDLAAAGFGMCRGWDSRAPTAISGYLPKVANPFRRA